MSLTRDIRASVFPLQVINRQDLILQSVSGRSKRSALASVFMFYSCLDSLHTQRSLKLRNPFSDPGDRKSEAGAGSVLTRGSGESVLQASAS